MTVSSSLSRKMPAQYCVVKGKTGAGCKVCKNKIEKGKLRIGTITPGG